PRRKERHHFVHTILRRVAGHKRQLQLSAPSCIPHLLNSHNRATSANSKTDKAKNFSADNRIHHSPFFAFALAGGVAASDASLAAPSPALVASPAPPSLPITAVSAGATDAAAPAVAGSAPSSVSSLIIVIKRSASSGAMPASLRKSSRSRSMMSSR